MVWDAPTPTTGVPDAQAEAADRRDRHAADARRRCAGSSTGSPLHPGPARRSDGDGAARRRAGARRPATGWRRADPPPDARGSPRRGARCWTRWPQREPRATARPGARGRGQRRRGARHGGCRAAGRRRRCRSRRRSRIPDPEHPGQVLSPDQAGGRRGAARRRWRRARSRVTLLDGVTGSGKTEVYLEAVAECLRAGPPGAGAAAGDRAVLAMAGALRAPLRRGAGGVALRPDLAGAARSPGGRWPTGAAPVVVGARSALFLPFPDLGLVVVDEEHETAFKQEEGVVYHARDMAVVRARFCAAPAVLVSATPSLETVANVEAGRYRAAALCRRGTAARCCREVAAIDLRDDAAGARPLPRAAADRGDRATRWRAASRRCCSSTAAAMRR